jgi:hypothetical protein
VFDRATIFGFKKPGDFRKKKELTRRCMKNNPKKN